MSGKIEELQKDLDEIENLQKLATRQKIKDILSIEERKITSEIAKLREKSQNNSTSSQPKPTNASVAKYQKKITDYGWSQTNKFFKLYVTLPKIQTIPSENVICKFTNKSIDLIVKDLDNKDYILTINHLLKTIDPDQSNWKIKTDMVIINLKKIEEINWSHVTEIEKKAGEAQKPTIDDGDSTDVNQSFMNLMKNMYDKGDDEMKRTIAKAWSESMNK